MATKPTQLRIPPELLAQIDAAAEAEGLTRTAWLLKAAQAQLGIASSRVEDSNLERRYRCPNGCGHEAKTPIRCNFCRQTLTPYGPLLPSRTQAA